MTLRADQKQNLRFRVKRWERKLVILACEVAPESVEKGQNWDEPAKHGKPSNNFVHISMCASIT